MTLRSSRGHGVSNETKNLRVSGPQDSIEQDRSQLVGEKQEGGKGRVDDQETRSEGLREENRTPDDEPVFFCWRLLGCVPGGAPFSQLNIGVTDVMAIIKS